MTTPGVHAFLIITRVGRFTPEEKNTVDFIRHIFGPDAIKYCIVVITGEDQLEEGQNLDEFINTSPALRDLVQACGNRRFGINNKLSGQPLERKTNQLIEIIDRMIKNNNGNYYTNDEYQRIERKRQEEKRKKEEDERRQKKAEEDAVIARTRQEERRRAEEKMRKVQEEERKKAEEKMRKVQEEERKNAEEKMRKIREEEQQKAEQRERELRRELDSARQCQRRNNYDDDNNINSMIRGLQSSGLGCGIPSMNGSMGMPFSPMSFGMETPSQRMGSGGSRIESAHGGRFTGEYMATRGAANSRPIYEGPRGGQYYMTPGGHKSYLRK
ncbi:unnamed protein product [Adineta steineri]|uniref:AIG1-type G domain-containing protein n=1 Tax=Adineta steineri TaxID=433720 RepID=A0A815VHY5_9BILA|nr:unnamed protein product [Adineta steineri]